MPTELEQALTTLRELARRGGTSTSEQDRQILLAPSEGLGDNDTQRIRELYDAMTRGFFHCAAEGYAFLPVQEIKQRFGRSLQENYPGASASFLRLATTYWTLKLVNEALFPGHHEKTASQLLFQLDLDIGSVFFPTPGPAGVSAAQREQAQRQLINESGAAIDVEDFIQGNPILRGTRSGCFGAIVAAWVFVSMAILWFTLTF